MSEASFRILSALALVDGELHAEEKRLLLAYAEAKGLSVEVAQVTDGDSHARRDRLHASRFAVATEKQRVQRDRPGRAPGNSQLGDSVAVQVSQRRELHEVAAVLR